MRYIFKFPDIGEGLTEGRIVEWRVKAGQEVKSGDPLVTMETDKVVTDIPSPKQGVVVKLYGEPGEVIHVGQALVEFDLSGVAEVSVAAATVDKPVAKEAASSLSANAGVVGTLEVAGDDIIMHAGNEARLHTSTLDKQVKVLATPLVKAIAKDKGIDLAAVTGTGPGGRVMKEDLTMYVQMQSNAHRKGMIEPKVTAAENKVQVVPLSQMRKSIARNMLRSKEKAAHLTIYDEVEVSELARIRREYKELYADENVKLTFLPFIVKAVCLALKAHLALNAEIDLEQGNMTYKQYYNIGIAMDTPKGLVVPVIKHADVMSIKDIAVAIQHYTALAAEEKLTLGDMSDGTFTITNYGSVGGKFGTPIINYPQSAIMGIGKISKQPVVKDDALTVGLVLPLSLSVDHCVVDGAESTRFLNQVMLYLNDPIRLMMD
ncbi:MAG: dihydrolipoamide acetyltransferase family protein [Tannerellaceae bacterium]